MLFRVNEQRKIVNVAFSINGFVAKQTLSLRHFAFSLLFVYDEGLFVDGAFFTSVQ